ncbi:MAG: pirin family protein, partial [Pyrinomonadaceae bacterium]
GQLRLIAARGGDDGAVHINQDVKVYASVINTGEELTYQLADGRHAWIQLISGSLDVNGQKLEAGDGAAVSEEKALTSKSLADNTEFLLFDLN